MEGAGKRTETGTEAASISRLSNDNIADILLRLPAKSVLCAGAVCKAWRCIATDTGFLTEHARLQQTNVALYSYKFSPRGRCNDNRPGYFEHALALELLPISSSTGDDDDDEEEEEEEAARRCLIRFPNDTKITFLVTASCNGVLLFHKSWEPTTSAISGYGFLLCNPTTRRWAEFPRLPPAPDPADDIIDEQAFYYHEPSGEYRLLLRHQRRSWFILSTGAAEPREVQVDLHARLPETMGTKKMLRATPVALQGRLHWSPCQAAGAPAAAGESETATEMVVFDTLSETFHLMAGPPTATADQTKVFHMEGRLVVADFGDEEHVDLWFLEDYNAGRWERRHRAPTPWYTEMPEPERRHPQFVAAAGEGDDREGTVMLGNHLGMLVYSLRTRTARTVGTVAASNHNIALSWHVFRENLERHPSFAARSAAELGLNFFWY